MKRFICWSLLILFFSLETQALVLNGKFTQGGLAVGRTLADTLVIYNGNPIRVSPKGIFVIGFNRDAKPTAQLELRYKDGRTRQETVFISKRVYKTEEIYGLPPEKVSPPKNIIEKINDEAILVAEVRKIDTAETHFMKDWRWPVKGRISGVYGSPRLLNGQPKRPHYGIDIAAPTGTEVVAPNSGIIRMVHSDMYLSGGTVIIDHGHGVSSALLHLKSIVVKRGQRISGGDIIGTVGSSGRATGPHLDWRVNLFKKRLDPQLLIDLVPKTRN